MHLRCHPFLDRTPCERAKVGALFQIYQEAWEQVILKAV